MLPQQLTRARPPANASQAHPGVHPLSPLTHQTQRFQPLPMPIGPPPYGLDVTTVVPGIAAKAARKLVFHTVGDTGGIKNPQFQIDVANAMEQDLNAGADAPQFFYHLGDVVYYNGQPSEYYAQFYEPYAHYNAPIFAIPGNHDGDPIDASQTSLDGWVEFFMTSTSHIDPLSHDAPRPTMTQPNVYWTLECPFVHIVGMYTNVPEHGSIDSVQQQWFTHEFARTPEDKALIVALHHPVYSFDDFHSGSPRMADVLSQAINDTKRVPNMVLTAHVHNYQRIEREIVAGTPTPFLVAGHGGYYHPHHLNGQDGTNDPNTGATLVKGVDSAHGYCTLTVDANQISGTMTTIATNAGPLDPQADTFHYSANAMTLRANAAAVSL
jgi:hypothetical protein